MEPPATRGTRAAARPPSPDPASPQAGVPAGTGGPAPSWPNLADLNLADLAHVAVFGWPCDQYTPPQVRDCTTVTEAVRLLLNSPRGRWDIREHVPLWPVEKWVATEFGGHTIWVDLQDRWVGFGVLNDDWETEEVAFMSRHLRPGDGMIDVGANIGVYTLAACRAVGFHGHVHAFEPMPRTAQMLTQSVAANGYAPRCTIHPIAAGASDRPVGFSVSHVNPGSSHVTAGTSDIQVPCRTLDSIDIRHRVTFLKVDIEGHEPRFLDGARRTLAAHRPLILTEFHPRALREVGGSSGRLYIEALDAAGYDCFEFDRGLGRPVTPETAGAYPEDAEPLNLVCRPR